AARFSGRPDCVLADNSIHIHSLPRLIITAASRTRPWLASGWECQCRDANVRYFTYLLQTCSGGHLVEQFPSLCDQSSHTRRSGVRISQGAPFFANNNAVSVISKEALSVSRRYSGYARAGIVRQ